MGEFVWTTGQVVGLLGGAYLFYGYVAGMVTALHHNEATVLVLTKNQFALVA
jgi:hypothetical protein